MSRSLNVLFLTLKIFSATGGIERVCRVVIKALSEPDQHSTITTLSMHDRPQDIDQRYLNGSSCKSFGGNRWAFSLQAIRSGIKSDIILLSHINLLVFGFLVKLLFPSKRLFLFAHGIEIWPLLSPRKRRWLSKCDKIICVSQFTKTSLVQTNGIGAAKCIVLNNCLDPFLLPPVEHPERIQALRRKLGINDEHQIIMTLSRLSAHDRDKGYERVIEALHLLKNKYPQLVYVVAGKYEQKEKAWLDSLIQQKGLIGSVIVTGYVPDEALADYFALADAYVMPSVKEGFGIIFIEALYYGLPVIAGNKDGSVDALANGQFGMLVNPYDSSDIAQAIDRVLVNPNSFTPDRSALLEKFGYTSYRQQLTHILRNPTGLN